MDAITSAVPQLLGIIWLNAILSGDNAIVIGMAAAGLPAHQRGRAVMFGIVAAAVLLRIKGRCSESVNAAPP